MGTCEQAAVGLIAFVALSAMGANVREVPVGPGGLSPQDALRQVRAERGRGDTAGTWTIRMRGRVALKETLVLEPADSDIRFVGEDGAALPAGDRRRAPKRERGGLVLRDRRRLTRPWP